MHTANLKVLLRFLKEGFFEMFLMLTSNLNTQEKNIPFRIKLFDKE